MTILPKKKPTKDKNEGETVDHQMALHPRHHQSTSENRLEKVARARNSPTRWLPPATREDKLTSGHDPGGSYDPHESSSGHNKRRHRSSPHRSHVRKHRGGGHTATATSIPQTSGVTFEEEEEEESGHNSGDEYVPPAHPDNIEELEKWFEKALKEKKGFIIKKMGQDGACLFRAVADQVFGDQEMHGTVRKQCIEYLAKNSDFYSQYVTEDFNTYLNRKRMDNCHGNHLEIQAMCELYNRAIEVYQYSIEPINTFHGAYKTDNEPIRISYHSNVHYNAIRDPYKPSVGVGLGLPIANFQPLLAEKHLIRDATRQSEEMQIEKAMFEDKARETDWEVTQETIEEQVARESYLQWLRDNEKRHRATANSRTASATCSSSSEYATLLENAGSPEARHGRSPRHKSSAPSSAQSSPQRVEHTEHHTIPNIPNIPNIPHIIGEQNSSPQPPMQAQLPLAPELKEGASGGYELETHSILNQYPQSIYADLANFSESDILAKVIAQSQQEYLDTLKKQNVSPTPPLPSSSPPHSPEASS